VRHKGARKDNQHAGFPSDLLGLPEPNARLFLTPDHDFRLGSAEPASIFTTSNLGGGRPSCFGVTRHHGLLLDTWSATTSCDA
jgi:hypothetical protein